MFENYDYTGLLTRRTFLDDVHAVDMDRNVCREVKVSLGKTLALLSFTPHKFTLQRHAAELVGQNIVPHLPEDTRIQIVLCMQNFSLLDRCEGKRVIFRARNHLHDESIAAKLLHFLLHLSSAAFQYIKMWEKVTYPIDGRIETENYTEQAQNFINPAILAQVSEASGLRFGLSTHEFFLHDWSAGIGDGPQQLAAVRQLCRRTSRLRMAPDDHASIVELVTNGLGRPPIVRELHLHLRESSELTVDLIDDIVMVCLFLYYQYFSN